MAEMRQRWCRNVKGEFYLFRLRYFDIGNKYKPFVIYICGIFLSLCRAYHFPIFLLEIPKCFRTNEIQDGYLIFFPETMGIIARPI